GTGPEVSEAAEVINLDGDFLMPGMIDAHTHLGIAEDGLGWEGSDVNETSDPVTPQMRALDALNPDNIGLKRALRGGVTTAMVAPGSANIIGGEIVVIKTAGETADEMVIKDRVGIKAALGENPKNYYGKQNQKAPKTRMAAAALMREAFIKARNYQQKKQNQGDEPFEIDLKLENLVRILNGEIPLKLHAHRADDIITGLRLAREFKIDLTLEHCTEGHKVAGAIADSGFPAIVGPIMTGPVKVELNERTFATAAALSEAGVEIALMSDHPVTPTKNLPIYAALAVRGGLAEEEALKAITINPARILGIEDRVGSIEPGKDADLVVFDGHPLDFRSRVTRVFLKGEEVESL
ncbi:MAG: amidohydrolase, partial [Bacillota bacterium]